MRIPKFRRNAGRESVARRERAVGRGGGGGRGNIIEQRMGTTEKSRRWVGGVGRD